MKKKLILITDGDNMARRAVETAAENLNLGCISRSAFRDKEKPVCYGRLVQYIKEAVNDIVLVMFDDMGNCDTGDGEKSLELIMQNKEFEVIGIIAVASNTCHTKGFIPDFSIDKEGNFYPGPVDKAGYHEKPGHKYLEGDTVDVLNKIKDLPLVIGIGDLGKMDGADFWAQGSPITTKAIKEILKKNGVPDNV